MKTFNVNCEKDTPNTRHMYKKSAGCCVSLVSDYAISSNRKFRFVKFNYAKQGKCATCDKKMPHYVKFIFDKILNN